MFATPRILPCPASLPSYAAKPVRYDMLIIGYGNTWCGDDGWGPAVAQRLAHLQQPGLLRVLAVQQLAVELAADLTETRLAVFLDATADGEYGVLHVSRLPAAAPRPAPLTHQLDPALLLGWCGLMFGPQHTPRAVVCAVGGRDFGLGQPISAALIAEAERTSRRLVRMIARRRRRLARRTSHA